jgi:hypothetical protein
MVYWSTRSQERKRARRGRERDTDLRSRKGYSVNAQETRKAQEREPYQEREQ